MEELSQILKGTINLEVLVSAGGRLVLARCTAADPTSRPTTARAYETHEVCLRVDRCPTSVSRCLPSLIVEPVFKNGI